MQYTTAVISDAVTLLKLPHALQCTCHEVQDLAFLVDSIRHAPL